MQEKMWTQADLQLLYPTPPQLLTLSTYTTVFIDLPLCHIPVKLPSSHYSSEQSMYLLHRGLYFFYLNSQVENPLVNTALVVFFQNEEDWRVSYNVWLKNMPYPKKTLLKPVSYFVEPTLRKYLILGRTKGEKNSYLVRSRRDGEYYNLEIIQHRSSEEKEMVNIYIQQLKTLQHPFIAQLREVFQTPSKTYLIFDFVPYLIDLTSVESDAEEQRILKKWSTQQIQTCLFETLFALLFIEQRNLSISSNKNNTIGVSKNGHILLRNFLDKRSLQTEDEPAFNLIEYLLVVLNTISPDDIAEQDPVLVDFFRYLHGLYEQGKNSIKEVVSHEYVRRFVSHEILGMGLDKIEIEKSNEGYNKQWADVSQCKSEIIYKQFEKDQTSQSPSYYNNQSYLMTPQSKLLSRFNCNERHESPSPRNSRNSRNSRNMRENSSQRNSVKKQTFQEFQNSKEEFLHKKRNARKMFKLSPYQAVLKCNPSVANYRKVL